MNWKLFIAGRIYRSDEGGKEVSKPAVRIAVAGIAIGLAVMIVSVAVVLGFKQEVRGKVTGLASEVVIANFDARKSYETVPVVADDSLLRVLLSVDGVSHAQRYSTKPGVILTDESFQGMVLKGVAGEYDWRFMQRHLVEGEIPAFTDTAATNRVLVSRAIADKLRLKTGDKLHTYYVDGENVRARRLVLAGIYRTDFAVFDDLFLITDLYTVNRLNGWEPSQASGVEIAVADYERLDEVRDVIREQVDSRVDKYGGTYYTQTVEEANPQIFAWLDLLDMNVWVILALMTGVAGFTMISGLLIIILERTNLIGVLKALGAGNLAVRQIFLGFAVFLIGRGMLWGNAIGLSLCFLQSQFHLFRLDPAVYYIDRVPVEFDLWLFLLLNVCTFSVSVLMLIGPSCLIARIHPARSIRFD